ncbi:MAG: amidohydrolase family protein [Anaerolineae bacterium]|nr:amidohydrolase family protein [Anaerolineae bacterium]
MPMTLDAWHAQYTEEALEPELPICDPHHHLWDDPRNRFSPYGLAELRRDIGARDAGASHNVVRTVFLDCSDHYWPDGPVALRPVGETAFVRQVAEESARTPGAEIAGIVAFADLTLGTGVIPVLEAHIEAGGGRFRGIRHPAGWDPNPGIGSYRNPPPGLLLDATYRQGAACLQRLGLSLDMQVYHHQLAELTAFARALPELTLVLDHTGIPLGIGPYAGKRDEVFRHWRGGMAELARCENVYVKLGGIGMPSFGWDWHTRPAPAGSEEAGEVVRPYFEACIELFGPARCMFESNYPVDRAAFSYTVLWNIFKRVAAGYSAADKVELFHDAAARAYRL